MPKHYGFSTHTHTMNMCIFILFCDTHRELWRTSAAAGWCWSCGDAAAAVRLPPSSPSSPLPRPCRRRLCCCCYCLQQCRHQLPPACCCTSTASCAAAAAENNRNQSLEGGVHFLTVNACGGKTLVHQMEVEEDHGIFTLTHTRPVVTDQPMTTEWRETPHTQRPQVSVQVRCTFTPRQLELRKFPKTYDGTNQTEPP